MTKHPDDAIDFSLVKTLLADAKNDTALFDAIVNIPFTDRLQATNLGLGIVVLLLVNTKEHTLDRIALSNTELAANAVKMSVKPFHEINIPLDYYENILITAVQTGAPQHTSDWRHMFAPVLTPQEARLNQAGAGIGSSVVYPLRHGAAIDSFGAMIFSYYEPIDNITHQHHTFMKHYAEIVSERLSTTKYSG